MMEIRRKLEWFLLCIMILMECMEGQLKSEDVTELSCPRQPLELYSGSVDYLWFLTPRKWFMPMASERLYRSLAETFLGRAARTEKELDLLNPRVQIVGNAVRVSGFERNFQAFCLPLSRPLHTFPKNLLEATCRRVWASDGVDITTIGGGTDSVLWTDNENVALIAPCFDGKYLDWVVNAQRPVISEKAKAEVLRRVSDLGFDPKRAAYYDYKLRKIMR